MPPEQIRDSMKNTARAQQAETQHQEEPPLELPRGTFDFGKAAELPHNQTGLLLRLDRWSGVLLPPAVLGNYKMDVTRTRQLARWLELQAFRLDSAQALSAKVYAKPVRLDDDGRPTVFGLAGLTQKPGKWAAICYHSSRWDEQAQQRFETGRYIELPETTFRKKDVSRIIALARWLEAGAAWLKEGQTARTDA